MMTLDGLGVEAEAVLLTPALQVQRPAWFCPHCRPLVTLLCRHPNADSLGDGASRLWISESVRQPHLLPFTAAITA